jgi:hypothetical protein
MVFKTKQTFKNNSRNYGTQKVDITFPRWLKKHLHIQNDKSGYDNLIWKSMVFIVLIEMLLEIMILSPSLLL